MEVLMVAALSAGLLYIAFRFLTSASGIFDSGTSKVNFFQEFRLALAVLEQDIRETGWRIDISPDRTNLKIAKFKTLENGLPLYDPQGFLVDGESVEYCFRNQAKTEDGGVLLRNGKAVLSSLQNAKFQLRKEMVNNMVIPTVDFELVYNPTKKVLTHYTGHLVPRHLASWAQHQFWASTSNGQRIKYTFR